MSLIHFYKPFSYTKLTLIIKSASLIFLALVFLISGCQKDDILVHEDIELNNTKWVIEKANEIPIRSTDNGLFPTLSFKDGFMKIETNCNTLWSEHKSNGNSLNFNSLTSTYMYCEDSEIESYFNTKIKSISSYVYNDGKLHLYIGKKRIGSFTRLED